MANCRLRLVRHGESEWNVRSLIQGHNDTPRLTALGRQQAADCCETLRDTGIDLIISSDLQRARETAEIINGVLDVELISTPLLRERSFGELEGVSNAQLTAENFGIVNGCVVNPNARAPQGESLNDLVSRADSYLSWLHENFADRSVLLVTHSGTVRALRAAHLGMSITELDWGDVANCSVWELDG
jgi:broad specificity phosphatase PhoE